MRQVQGNRLILTLFHCSSYANGLFLIQLCICVKMAQNQVLRSIAFHVNLIIVLYLFMAVQFTNTVCQHSHSAIIWIPLEEKKQ